MFLAVGVATNGDGARAADHDNASPIGKGTDQGGALIAGHHHLFQGQIQGSAGQGLPLGLHPTALLDAAGADGRRPQRQRSIAPFPWGQAGPGLAQALDQGRLEALRPLESRQMAHPRSLSFRHDQPVDPNTQVCLRPGQAAGGVGLAGIEAGDQSRHGALAPRSAQPRRRAASLLAADRVARLNNPSS